MRARAASLDCRSDAARLSYHDKLARPDGAPAQPGVILILKQSDGILMTLVQPALAGPLRCLPAHVGIAARRAVSCFGGDCALGRCAGGGR
jgi:hypothetical protein